jgi:tripartite-type tricarboxylate transporter receptor subunit TctC
MHKHNKFGLGAFFVAMAFCAVQAIAQPAYPSRPIRFIVPFPPGGGAALPEVRDRLGALGYEPASLSTAEFTGLVTADFQRFGRLAREIGLRADQ